MAASRKMSKMAADEPGRETEMLRLWGRETSSNVMKVIWLLEDLKIPYERIDVGGPFGRTQTPEYLAMNPMALVPTLDDDGFVLWESNAILRYLCQTRAPQSALFGPDAKARALIDHWMDFQQTTLNRPQSVLFVGYVRTQADQRDAKALDSALIEASKPWSIVDAALAQTPFISSPVLTLADIAFGVHVHRWFNLPIERPNLHHLRAWYDRLLALPIYDKHIARPMV
jgi:glutathione S-transferase